jgi:hypothetical protein
MTTLGEALDLTNQQGAVTLNGRTLDSAEGVAASSLEWDWASRILAAVAAHKGETDRKAAYRIAGRLKSDYLFWLNKQERDDGKPSRYRLFTQLVGQRNRTLRSQGKRCAHGCTAKPRRHADDCAIGKALRAAYPRFKKAVGFYTLLCKKDWFLLVECVKMVMWGNYNAPTWEGIQGTKAHNAVMKARREILELKYLDDSEDTSVKAGKRKHKAYDKFAAEHVEALKWDAELTEMKRQMGGVK